MISPQELQRRRAPLIPNKETIEAMKAAERGEVTTVGHPRNLLKSLNADGFPGRPRDETTAR
jgi:hypothetical protein